MKELIKKILGLLGPFKRTVFVILLYLISAQLLNLASPYIYGKIIDSFVSQKTLQETFMLIAIAGFVYILSVTLSYFQNVFEIKKFDYDFSAHIAHKTLEKFFNFSIGQHVNQHSGIKQSVIKKGESAINDLANGIIYDVLPVTIETVIVTTALLIMTPLIGVIILFFDVIFILLTFHINRTLEPELAKYKDMDAEEGKFYSEMMRNVELVQVNVQENKLAKDYDGVLDTLFSFGKKIWVKFMALSTIRSVLVSIVKISVMALGVYLIYQGEYTPGNLIIILSWSSSVFNSLWRIGNMHRRLTDKVETIKKYITLMEVDPDIVEIENPVVINDLQGKIEFKNVVFKYPKRKYIEDEKDVEKENNGVHKEHETEKELPNAMDGVNFTIEAGQKAAFVGHSGAGKSTLAHMLLRAYDPTSGQILIDGIDLKNLKLKDYRKKMGIVEQSVSLFDNTLKYNILFGLGEDAEKFPDEKLEKVAQMACVDKFFDRLEDKFETTIGEKGVKLSGGERQRVGIARALAKEPRILIFDEATSSLDTENETLIYQAIKEAAKGRTTIIIAHRLSTIRDADKIFVMEKGKVVGEGTHAELMKKCTQYKNLVKRQVVAV